MIMLKNALRNAPFCYISPIRVFEWLLIISCICAGKGMIFKMKNLGYYNGKFGPLEEMMVPMNDRVCYNRSYFRILQSNANIGDSRFLINNSRYILF